MSQQPTQTQMNRFVKEVDLFMRNTERLNNPQFRATVYKTNDAQVIADYNNAVERANVLKGTIEATTGAWDQAKAFYRDVSATSSTVIGDAIDNIRSWFGYDPSGGLGALQVPMAVWVGGIIVAAVAANKMMANVFIQVEAARLQREQGLSRSQALKAASNALAPSLFRSMNTGLLLFGGIGMFLLLRSR